jgi:two-component system CheB/CheR fusion protein
MEAAKEELESSNEELLALNEELRLKNNELNAAKYFSDNIIETARAIFITTDKALNISSVNQFSEEVTGYSRSEIIGKSCLNLFFPDHTVILYQMISGNSSPARLKHAKLKKNFLLGMVMKN